jgi:hypothetical protein
LKAQTTQAAARIDELEAALTETETSVFFYRNAARVRLERIDELELENHELSQMVSLEFE